MRADLSLQQAPPFSVPARFLISAPFFGLFAAMVLLWHGPDIMVHRWTPQLLAVTHLITLGFLAMSMMGAMMQLMPVLMGSVFPRPVIFSSIVHTTLFFGCLFLCTAWLLSIKELFIFSAILLTLCFLTFISVTGTLLFRSSGTRITRHMMIMAISSLFVTVCIGLYLSMGHSGQNIPLLRQLTDLHLSWGLVGWVALLIMSVAYQVIPMFQITDEYPLLHQRFMGWLLLTGLVLLSFSYTVSTDHLKLIVSIVISLGLLLFSLTTLWVLYKRRRQLPDLTLNFWRLAMVSLACALLLGIYSTLSNNDMPAILLGILMIYGFAMSSVNGMMYKIIPFIIWLHLSALNKKLRDNDQREDQIKVPHMRNIISSTSGNLQFGLHSTSVIFMSMMTIWPSWSYYPAAITLALSQAILIYNLLKAARYYISRSALLYSALRITQQ